jgi:hypothetical protein
LASSIKETLRFIEGAYCATGPKRIIEKKKLLQDFHWWPCLKSQKSITFKLTPSLSYVKNAKKSKYHQTSKARTQVLREKLKKLTFSNVVSPIPVLYSSCTIAVKKILLSLEQLFITWKKKL